ncbi:BOS complex subunit NOMO3 isoform X2 [Rhodnius prolixus]|uniref:BOS complex subunit NOMO3 isoform X2 n=1 Tax=Rhodnius prolixus TaxID=13249 RepID=UPI003D189C0B
MNSVDYKKFIVFICSFLFRISAGDDILGCNGFIKSDIPINYSDVEVKLLTKQGSVKDHTDCAPNNGYYFLPVYDKGEYVLKVSPPEGWKFEPEQVSVLIDGATDPCSTGKDINFIFKGFAISGTVVSLGEKIGPKGVIVDLIRDVKNISDKDVISTTTSTENGNFIFSPVVPGKYLVRISHPRWTIRLNEAFVEVKNGNGNIPPGKLIIGGYDVSGTVTSDSQPINGVSFVLFSKIKSVYVSGCATSTLPGFNSHGLNLENWAPICHVASNANGIFIFPQLQPGQYLLVPHYKGAKSTKFDVHPRTLPFTVTHDSLQLTTSFEVKGFTVSGKVLWSENGKPMSDASIYLNGKEVTKTGIDGVYNLESMRAGTYKIKVEKSLVEFEESEIKMSSTTLPDLFPNKYRVCGKMHSVSSTGPYRIDIKSENEDSLIEVETDSKGNYCKYLSPGKYIFSPYLNRMQKNNGLLFSPMTRVVEIIDSPLDNINFSQLRSTVKGKIVCMSVCPLITVNLKPKGQGGLFQTIAKGGTYEFKDVMPGDYDVYIEPGLGWCWDKETQPLAIINEVTHVPTFTQSGFTVTIVSSHDTKVIYYSETDINDKYDLSVTPGSTHICVPKPTPYIFEPFGCHGYPEKKIRWVTGTVSLIALTHLNSYSLLSTHPISDLSVAVTSMDSASSHPTKIIPKLAAQVTDNVRYDMNIDLKEGEILSLIPSAPTFLFSPQTIDVRGHNDCINVTEPLFKAEKGHVISGRVVTGANVGLGDVLVTIKDEDDTVIFHHLTAPDGTYTSPPIKSGPNYKVVAEKEGFILTALARQGDFSAHKLAEIIVVVRDIKDTKPLQGVLLSLSGGKSYRRNAQTNADGSMSFLSLSPGEYFLRPMMKEYRFRPQNKIIKVNEGATEHIILAGERVAFSGIGEVVSLSGEGESGVVVEAIGLDQCHLLQEEATSNEKGHFRIRGLKPMCSYNVHVKQGADINKHIQTSSTDNVTITVPSSDISGIRLFAMRPTSRTDVLVYVLPDRPEDLKTLRLRLSREEAPEALVGLIKLSDYKPSPDGYMLSSVPVLLPPLPADGRTYILQMESSLSQATHEYTLRPIHFKASGSSKRMKKSRKLPTNWPVELFLRLNTADTRVQAAKLFINGSQVKKT